MGGPISCNTTPGVTYLPNICSANVAPGTTVTLTASTGPAFLFLGWSAAACGNTLACTIEINADISLTANFGYAAGYHGLSVSLAGSGSGIVVSDPAVIQCGARSTGFIFPCSAVFAAGTQVALAAYPSTGSVFEGWSTGPCPGSGACVVTMDANQSVTAQFSREPTRLVNLSTRMQVSTGDHVLIGGFIIGGSARKTVVVRARGPSLGMRGALSNPTIALYSGQTMIAGNDNWQTAANAAALQSSGFAPPDPNEAAILTALDPGPYTAIVSGAGGATGVAIVEVFEVDASTTPLINISTRGQVLTGDNVMIGGFIIQGSEPQTVVVRARGPSLAALGVPGVLADPSLDLYSGQAVVASNDNWQAAPNAAALQATGLAPLDMAEAAILITLNPGAYTAIVSGVGHATGVAIVEVFAAP